MSTKIVRNLLAVYLGSAFAAGAVTVSSDAHAWWTRSSASSCVELAGNDSPSFNPGCNDSTTNSKIYTCNVPDTSAMQKVSISTLNVHIEKFVGGFAAVSRCVQFRDTTGAACGPSAQKTSNGISAVSPATFSHWTQTNYGYLMVLLPPSPSTGSSNQSCLKGFLTSG